MIEVGEYYRTENGYIDKIRNIDKQENVFKDEKGKLQLWLGETVFGDPYSEEITKHSKNIIDLIEYGDILEIFVNDNETDRVVVYGDILQAIKHGDLIAEDIKTILTHELYEQNCYKVVI